MTAHDIVRSSQTITGARLIMDDDPAVAMLLQGLRVIGYTVKVATSGEEALDPRGYVSAGMRCCSISACRPGMTGGEVLDALRQRHPRIPIVVMTGDPERARGRTARGAVAYLLKAFTVPSVQEAVRAALAASAQCHRSRGELKRARQPNAPWLLRCRGAGAGATPDAVLAGAKIPPADG